MQEIATALGIETDAARTDLVDPLDGEGIRLVRFDGVYWVAVIILM